MNEIIILELKQVDNNGKNLHIGILLSDIKEITEIPNVDYCLVNGHEINVSFFYAVMHINSYMKKS